MYLQGVRTRRDEKTTGQLCIMTISATTLSRITAILYTQLERWRKRRLTQQYYYLNVDARNTTVTTNEPVSSQVGANCHTPLHK